MNGETPGDNDWEEHANDVDRVQSVALTVSQPRSASYIADEAHVTKSTASEYLNHLVAINVLQDHHSDCATLYSLDPLYDRMSSIRDLIDDNDRDTLEKRREELKEQIVSWKDDYGANSPDLLRRQARNMEPSGEARDLHQTANVWRLALYRLSLIEEAMRNYVKYNRNA